MKFLLSEGLATGVGRRVLFARISAFLVLGALILSATSAPSSSASSAATLTTSLTTAGSGQTTAQGYPGAAVNFTNTLPSPVAVLVFGATLNSLGQMVSYSVQGSTIAAGGSVAFFFSVPPAPHANYTVVIFAVTPAGVPVSGSTSVPVSV